MVTGVGGWALCVGPREGTPIPIIEHGREVLRWQPPFLRFSIWLGPYFMPLSHLVSEIFGPKVDQIFHENVLFNGF